MPPKPGDKVWVFKIWTPDHGVVQHENECGVYRVETEHGVTMTFYDHQLFTDPRKLIAELDDAIIDLQNAKLRLEKELQEQTKHVRKSPEVVWGEPS